MAISSDKWIRPKTANMVNQINITGPNNFPIDAVPNCCRKKNAAIMPRTMYTIVCCGRLWSGLSSLRPSMAEVIDIGGVIMPSASKAAPPMMAGIMSHRFCRLTNAYSAKIPPSPLLSARKTSHTYLIVVWIVSVQMIHDRLPRMTRSSIILFLTIALKT